jgi:hypothetical protein
MDAVGYEKNHEASPCATAASGVEAPWKPDMYCAKPSDRVAACARGEHEWTDDPGDACVHCVLDLNDYVPMLHRSIAAGRLP